MFEEVAESLIAEDPGVARRKMFGHVCLMNGSKGFAVDHEEDIVLKLPEPQRSQALSLGGAHLFDPMGGRPMKEWVQIPLDHEDKLLDLARAAKNYVAA